jgi:RNA polymerase sigma-70 factor, ECF subfamily
LPQLSAFYEALFAGQRSYVSSEASAYSSSALAKMLDIDFPARATHAEGESPALIGARTNLVRESSDETLLALVGNSDKEALSVLFQRYARGVYNVARRILKDDSEAEDLVQELFLFIFQKAQTFDSAKSSASSWIIQMAYHRAIDRRRYLSFRQHYKVQELDEERLIGNREQVHLNELAGNTLLNKLRKELSPEQQQTLELHFFEGYSFHEIAEKTGQTFGNVRNHYYRGLERLRSHIFPGKRSSK